MGRKLLVAVMSMMLLLSSFAPAFAEEGVINEANEPQLIEEVDEGDGESSILEENDVLDEEASQEVSEPKVQTNSVEEVSVPKVVSYEATSPEFQCLRVNWTLSGADNVKVYISSDRSMQGVSPMSFSNQTYCEVKLPDSEKWKATYIRIVPYKGNEAGQLVEFGTDIFDEYKPVSVNVKNNVFAYESGVSLPTIIAKDKKGREIPNSYMKQQKVSSKYPGKNTMTVRYTGMYSGLPDFEVPYTLLPGKPESFQPWWLEKDSIQFMISLPRQYYSDTDKYVDYGIIEWSKSADFSNAQTIKITKNSSSSKKAVKNLAKNTTYYFRAKSVKKVDGGTICSDWVKMNARTLGNAPSTSVQNATTKQIIANMRKNKSFEIKLPCKISRADAYKYVDAIKDPRPHLDKFKITYVSKSADCSAVSSLKYTYNSTKAKKANALNKKVMKIVKGAKKKKGTRAKVKYVNKQMCKTCSYHWAAYRASNGYLKYPDAYTAYGCLVKHKAVCSGYTDAFAAIMTELNIPNGYGHSPNHIWNKVKIGKTWYHVDVTWNDSTHSSKYLLKKSHPKK